MSFRSARENAGYALTEVARILNLETSTPRKWEAGINMPRAATLAKLAALYGCSIEYLLTGNGSEQEQTQA